MRLIDADALFRKVKTECNPYGKPSIGFEDGKKVMNWIEQAPTVSVKPKRESMAMLPCKCGYKRREHWYGNKNGYERALVCKRCGFEVHGENDTDVIRKWNEAVKGND